jgi:hypothetical protein
MSVVKVRWHVDELANVMTLYDTQKVYRSTTSDPYAWTEVTNVSTRVTLVAGTADYYYDDTDGLDTYYYSVAYYNSSTLAESEKSSALKAALGTDYLTLQDLYNLAGHSTVLQFFDDDYDGAICDESWSVNAVLRAAEAEAAARLRRGWTVDGITELGTHDLTFRSHVAWVALEMAAERRKEFLSAEGRGPFAFQYERAIQYFEKISKGRLRPYGETEAGTASTVGGTVQPTVTTEEPRFIFAPDRDNPTGHGGF